MLACRTFDYVNNTFMHIMRAAINMDFYRLEHCSNPPKNTNRRAYQFKWVWTLILTDVFMIELLKLEHLLHMHKRFGTCLTQDQVPMGLKVRYQCPRRVLLDCSTQPRPSYQSPSTFIKPAWKIYFTGIKWGSICLSVTFKFEE